MSNIFDTSGSVQAVTQNQTPIQGGVVDKTPAMAIQAGANLVNKAVGDVVSQNVVNKATNILQTPETQEIPEIAPYMDRLGKVADGIKAGMQKNKAQIMARSIVAEAVNQNPFYAKEIRARASSLFGIGGGTTSASGAVAGQKSPEEKALDDYRESVTKTQLEYGVSQGTAQQVIQDKRQAELRKLQAENFTDDIYSGVTDATVQMQDTIFKTVFSSPTGTLDPQAIRGLGIDIERSAVNLQKTLMQSATNRGAITKDTFETIDNQVKTYKQNMKNLVTDQSAMKWMQTNNDLAAQYITAWGNQNYGGMIELAKNNAIPDSMKEAMFRAMAGDERAQALITNNPMLGDMMSKTQSLSTQLRKAYAGVINDMYGVDSDVVTTKKVEKVGDDDKAVAVTLALNDKQGGAKFNHEMVKTHRATTQETIDKALTMAPENISRWTTPQYRAEWASDPQGKVLTIDHELDVVSRTIRGRIFSTMEDAQDFNNVRVSEPRAAMADVQGASSFYGPAASAPEVSISGNVNPYIKSRIVDMYRVLKENPEVWEDKAESIGEYVNNLIHRPVDWRKPTKMRQQKAKNLGNDVDDGVNRNTEVAKTDKEQSKVTPAKTVKEQGPRTDADYQLKLTKAVNQFKADGLTLDAVLDHYDSLGLTENEAYQARRREIVEEWERS